MNIFRRKQKDGKLASPFYYTRFTYQGKSHIESTNTTDARLARQILHKRHTQAVEGKMLDKVKPIVVPILSEYAQNFLNGYALNKRSRRCDQSILKKSILPAFGKNRLDQIASVDVERWRNTRLRSPRQLGKGIMAPASVRLELALLKTILGLAVRDGLIEKNPVKAVKMPRVNNQRDRVATPDEYARLQRAVSQKAPYLGPILVLAYETGMRKGEILGLRWANLKRRPGFAYLPDTKNGTSRWVPLNAMAREALDSWPRRADTDLVFSGPMGKPMGIKTAWKSLWRRARVDNLRFHDLRHTFTTRMLEKGVSIRAIMAITGHKSVAMFHRYSHPSDSHLLAAVEALGQPSGNKSGNTGKHQIKRVRLSA